MPFIIVILGGYGYTGRALTPLLLKFTDFHLVLAGRNKANAEADAQYWNRQFPGQRVSGAFADAADRESLRAVYKGARMVVVAAGVAPLIENVARTAIAGGLDYLDFQVSSAKLRLLESMERDIENAGACFVTDGGFHPGMAGLLIRHLAHGMDQVETAGTASVLNPKGGFPYTSGVDELMELFLDYPADVLRDGKWVRHRFWDLKAVPVDFGEPFGVHGCYPMGLEELKDLPRMVPGLKNAGFYVGGMGPLVDYFVSPIVMAGLFLFRRSALKPMGKFLAWGTKFTSPPYGVVLKAEVTGVRNGKPDMDSITLFHEDGYHFTAAPAAACIRQMLCPERVEGLKDPVRKSGLYFQAHLPDTHCFMRDLQTMGIRTL